MAMDHNDLFDSLVNNAVDFFKRSIEELNSHPKYSVIHFVAAVELFFKARLMREHWSLIVQRSDRADWKKFLEGDFVSVSLDEAVERLRRVANESLGRDERECFSQLRDHRNRLVHFFHQEYVPPITTAAREDVVAEQARGWFYLHSLLSGPWAGYFLDFASQVDDLDRLLKKHQAYLNARFEGVKGSLQEAEQEGSRVCDCPACGFEALVVEPVVDRLVASECKVCGLKDGALEVECPDCENAILTWELGEGRCPGCHRDVDLNYVLSLYHRPAFNKDDLISDVPAFCSFCEYIPETVVHIDVDEPIYLCVACLTRFDRLDQCGYCASSVAGELEDSFLFGCVACDGRMSSLKED